MQGLSSRAHAFSVEALVGKPSCKKMKVEDCKEEKATQDSVDPEGEDSSACTVINEAQEPGKRRKGSAAERRAAGDEQPGLRSPVRVDLQGADLWTRFHDIGTEMIITKAGRRMFPSVRVKVKNLDPFKQYYIAMDILPVDSKRYRYVYHSSQWMVAGNTDHSCITPRLYVHPDSPCSGETWMRQVISFDRVKLTNNEMDDKGHIILQSMHKYKPRVHVIVHDPRLDLSQIQSLPAEGVQTFAFPETEFTTVTAYQNQQITKLKIDRNPFAKGFRDPGRNRGVLDGILETYPWRSPLSLDFKHFALETQGGNSGSASNCGTLSPLKGLLSPSCSPTSFPFSLPCSDSSLHSLGLPVCYKVPPSANLLGSRPYSIPGPDRLRGSLGLQPLADFPLLSSLRSGKAHDCRGHYLQGPPPSPGQLSLQRLHSSSSNGSSQAPLPLHHDSPPSSLSSPYGLYSYNLPMPSRFASISRHFTLTDSVPLTPAESLLPPAPWNSTINHCL